MSTISVVERLKRQAKLLHKRFESLIPRAGSEVPTLSQTQDIVARLWKFSDWHEVTEITRAPQSEKDGRFALVARLNNKTTTLLDYAAVEDFEAGLHSYLASTFQPVSSSALSKSVTEAVLGISSADLVTTDLPWIVVAEGASGTLWDSWSIDRRLNYLSLHAERIPDAMARLNQIAGDKHPRAMYDYAVASGFNEYAPSESGLEWMLAAYADAYAFAKRGCEIGDAHLCNLLGTMLAEGNGVKCDNYSALDAFLKIPSCTYAEARTSQFEVSWFIDPVHHFYDKYILDDLFSDADEAFKGQLYTKFSIKGIWAYDDDSEAARLHQDSLVPVEYYLRHRVAIEHFFHIGKPLLRQLDTLSSLAGRIDLDLANELQTSLNKELTKSTRAMIRETTSRVGSALDRETPACPMSRFLEINDDVPAGLHSDVYELFAVYDSLMSAIDGLFEIENTESIPQGDARTKAAVAAFNRISSFAQRVDDAVAEARASIRDAIPMSATAAFANSHNRGN